MRPVYSCILLFFSFLPQWRTPSSTLFPYTTLFRSRRDLAGLRQNRFIAVAAEAEAAAFVETEIARLRLAGDQLLEDRKSTRLNSSHLVISYAVFCLKKKIIYLSQLINRII